MPFLPLRDLPDPGMEAKCPASLALAGGFFTAEPPGKPNNVHIYVFGKSETKMFICISQGPFRKTASILNRRNLIQRIGYMDDIRTET